MTRRQDGLRKQESLKQRKTREAPLSGSGKRLFHGRFKGSRPPDGDDYRVYRLTAGEWLRYGAQGAALCGLAAYTFYRSITAFFLLLPLGLCYPLWKKKNLQKERTRKLTLQFKEGILILASFLGVGYSLENGLSMSVKELERLCGADAMITEEFGRLAAGVRMNHPPELLLTRFGERSGIQDVDNFAQIFAVARRSGGELVAIIGHTAGIIRDKVQVQEEIHTMTAVRVFEQRIMNGIPFAIILYIDLTSPGFFHVMYETFAGRAVMTFCLLLYAGAVLLADHILEIEV